MIMKSAIYKYRLTWASEQTLELPKNSEFLCLALQEGEPTIWYKHNPLYEDKRSITIVRRPTGESSGLFPGEDYITTLFTENEAVWHFFFKH